MREVAEGLKPTFEMLPNVVSILEKDNDNGPSEMSLIVDRDKASSVGVEPRSLAYTISSAISGSQLPRFMSEGRQIPIRLQFTEEDKAELDPKAANLCQANLKRPKPARLDHHLRGNAALYVRDQHNASNITPLAPAFCFLSAWIMG